MATKPFVYQEPLPLGPDTTTYRLLSKEGVSTTAFEGREILKVDPQVLTHLARTAFRDCAFLLRTSHLEKLAKIVDSFLSRGIWPGYSGWRRNNGEVVTPSDLGRFHDVVRGMAERR